MITSRKPDAADKQRGKQLARLRKANGLSQAELASKLGVSTQQLGKYERGENRIPISRHDKALQLLGVRTSSPAGFAEGQEGYDAPDQAVEELQHKLEEMRAEIDRVLKIVKRL